MNLKNASRRAALFFLNLVISTSSYADLSNVTDLVSEADREYDKGDCQRANQIYSILIQNKQIPNAVYEVTLFRKAYCDLILNHPDEASIGFEEFIKTHPDNEEARLRLAESYLQNGKYVEAMTEAQKVQSNDLRMEGALLAVRAALESGDSQEALHILKKIKDPGEFKFLMHYWAGLTYYRIGNAHLSKSFFQSAKKSAPSGHWVISSANDWLEQIDHDLRPIRGQLSLGYLYDSNIGQSGTQSVTTSGIAETAKTSADPNTNIHDGGYWVAAELGFLPYYSHPLAINMTFDFSSPYYLHDHSYNLQSYSGEISATNTANPNWTPTLSVKYLDTRYDRTYYQDYLITTPSLAWQADSQLSFRATMPYTRYVKSRHGNTIAPLLSGRWVPLSWFSLGGGGSYSKSSDEKAVYVNSSSTSVASGIQFSNYSSLGAFLTASFYLPERFIVTPVVSQYKTSYGHEAVPTAATRGTIGDRSDTLKSWGVEVSREMIINAWTMSLNYNSSSNSSSGFQGIPSSTTMYNYNYDRTYFMLNNTLNF